MKEYSQSHEICTDWEEAKNELAGQAPRISLILLICGWVILNRLPWEVWDGLQMDWTAEQQGWSNGESHG